MSNEPEYEKLGRILNDFSEIDRKVFIKILSSSCTMSEEELAAMYSGDLYYKGIQIKLMSGKKDISNKIAIGYFMLVITAFDCIDENSKLILANSAFQMADKEVYLTMLKELEEEAKAKAEDATKELLTRVMAKE